MTPTIIKLKRSTKGGPDALSWGQAETDAEKDKWAVDNGYQMLRLPEEAMRSTGARELLFGVI